MRVWHPTLPMEGTQLTVRLSPDLLDLISSRTGLRLSQHEQDQLLKEIAKRFRSSGDYVQLLQSATPQATREWKALIAEVTIGETYLFRDQGQCQLLSARVLPELIRQRGAERTLRIWSAGCSTGEEAYTLAMLVDELLPNRQGWDIRILGTDLNQLALEKARSGLYGAWSFRLVGSDVRDRYFDQTRQGWKLDDRIQSMVTFRTGNLVADLFPDSGGPICDLDLILCRNVFIYLNPKAVSSVVTKFGHSLRQGGFLLTGHAELQPAQRRGLEAVIHPESVIFRRPFEQDEQRSSPPPPPRPAPAHGFKPSGTAVKRKPAEGQTEPSLLEEADALYKLGAYAAAIDRIRAVLTLHPRDARALLLRARAQANLGDYAQAEDSCKEALAEAPLRPEPYSLLAQIQESLGHPEEARALWKRVIYLEPGNPSAYIELASLYDAAGDSDRALRMRRTAAAILRSLPPDSMVPLFEAIRASELLDHMQMLIGADGGDEHPVPHS